jgi:hypothetical protein
MSIIKKSIIKKSIIKKSIIRKSNTDKHVRFTDPIITMYYYYNENDNEDNEDNESDKEEINYHNLYYKYFSYLPSSSRYPIVNFDNIIDSITNSIDDIDENNSHSDSDSESDSDSDSEIYYDFIMINKKKVNNLVNLCNRVDVI